MFFELFSFKVGKKELIRHLKKAFKKISRRVSEIAEFYADSNHQKSYNPTNLMIISKNGKTANVLKLFC
jgi:hypothetical protein